MKNTIIQRLSLVIFLVTLLSGCISKHRYDAGDFSSGQKSVVIISSKTHYQGSLFFKKRDKASDLIMFWKSTHSPESFISLNNVSFLDDSKNFYEVYQINPGQYYLEKYSYSGSDGPSLFNMVYTPKKEQINFDIKPGEILYIGNFLLHDDQEDGNLIVNDIFDEAQKYIQDTYPELASKLTKKIIQLPRKIEFIDDVDKK